MLLALAGFEAELPAGLAHNALPHLLPLSSSGSGSSLPDPAEAAERGEGGEVQRSLQRKLAQKEAQQRYRCVPALAESSNTWQWHPSTVASIKNDLVVSHEASPGCTERLIASRIHSV